MQVAPVKGFNSHFALWTYQVGGLGWRVVGVLPSTNVRSALNAAPRFKAGRVKEVYWSSDDTMHRIITYNKAGQPRGTDAYLGKILGSTDGHLPNMVCCGKT